MFLLEAELQSHFPSTVEGFSQIMGLKGEVYRALEGRRTQRIRIGEHAYFIKQHHGVGWKEILKNIACLRMPIVSAKPEWKAIQRLKKLNVAVLDVVGFGCRGINPASLQSFIVTRELSNSCSLEELVKTWEHCPPTFSDKLMLIKEVARIARTLHENGINHRDFYLCHFLLDKSAPISGGLILYLIDLHRAGIHKYVPERWIIKDLAGLYFSSKDVKLTARDLLRFIKEYRHTSLHDVFKKEILFWQKVKKRGDKLYRKHHP